MAAHRYWRLFISDTNGGGGNSAVIGELILATTAGGASVATGGTASASDDYYSSYLAANAFDGIESSSNAWCSALRSVETGPVHWIQYDFGGTPRDIVEMRIYFPAAGPFTLAQAPKNFALYWSDDGKTWTRQRAWSEQTFTAGGTNTYDAAAVPSVAITNRYILGPSVHRYTAAALPQTFFASVSRPSSGFARSYNWTRPWSVTPYSGKLRIAGSTTVLGLPKARRVDLLDQKSGLIVDRRNTGPDGVFAFEQLADGVYTLVGVDNSAEQNSVIYAHVTPVP